MTQHVQLPEKFGRYRITKMLGAGGMGVVYLAKDMMRGEMVALKVPRLDQEDDPQAIDRFLREARVALGIQHPNLCHVLEVDAVDGVHFLTMPYVQGMPLSKQISPDKPWPPERALAFIAKLAQAMQVVHQRGIMHRDLKPQNIMVKADGEPVIMDFGLARGFGSEATRLTATGAALGTPVYMSPEQIKGQKDIGPRTDIYSLGVILYELLCGKPPFAGNAATVLTHILYKQPVPPSEKLPALGKKYDALCLKALAKAPEERYASMAEFATTVAKFLSGRATHGGGHEAPPPRAAVTPPTPGRPPATPPHGSGASGQARPPSSSQHPALAPKPKSHPELPPVQRPSEVLRAGQDPRRSGDRIPISQAPDPRRTSGQIPAPPPASPRASGQIPAAPAPPLRAWQQQRAAPRSLAPWFWVLGGGAVALVIVLVLFMFRSTMR